MHAGLCYFYSYIKHLMWFLCVALWTGPVVCTISVDSEGLLWAYRWVPDCCNPFQNPYIQENPPATIDEDLKTWHGPSFFSFNSPWRLFSCLGEMNWTHPDFAFNTSNCFQHQQIVQDLQVWSSMNLQFSWLMLDGCSHNWMYSVSHIRTTKAAVVQTG